MGGIEPRFHRNPDCRNAYKNYFCWINFPRCDAYGQSQMMCRSACVVPPPFPNTRHPHQLLLEALLKKVPTGARLSPELFWGQHGEMHLTHGKPTCLRPPPQNFFRTCGYERDLWRCGPTKYFNAYSSDGAENWDYFPGQPFRDYDPKVRTPVIFFTLTPKQAYQILIQPKCSDAHNHASFFLGCAHSQY